MTGLDLAIAGLYVVGMLVLGYLVSGSIRGFRDYFVAGGRMTAPLLVCTLVSTYYGLDVLLGGSEVGYVDGVVGWFWCARPYYLAILLTAFLLASRLRRRDLLSLPDVAAASCGGKTRTRPSRSRRGWGREGEPSRRRLYGSPAASSCGGGR